MKYDQKFKYKITNEEVDIGIVDGNNTIVLIIPGQNTGLYGYEDRYLKLSKHINSKYGATVIISSNPYKNDDPIDELMYIVKRYAERFEDYKVYYFGFSKGANIGSQFATKYEQIKRLVLINGPLMINPHKTKEGIINFKDEKMTFMFGSLDPSYKYAELVTMEEKDNIILKIIDNMNHNVENEEIFLSLPDKTLFF